MTTVDDDIIPPMDPNRQMLNDILNLTRENNQMLHSQRHWAFFWGFVKFVFYLAIFSTTIWFILTYVTGTLDHLVTAMNKIQGIPQQTETKFDGFEQMLKGFAGKLPAFLQPAFIHPQVIDTATSTQY